MTLTQKDLKYIWHPYTHQKNMMEPIAIVKGQGALLFDENGKEYIDATSSWWVNIHGHSNSFVAKKMYKQAKTLEHVIFAGFTHKPAIDLAEKLIPLLPGDQSKIFYSDNGSTAVEVALKMALQFWKNTGNEKRNKIMAFKNSYHGDTFGAMSASSRSIFTKAFDEKLFDVVFIDLPSKNNLEEIKIKIEEIKNEVACFIYEPLLQGAGGMIMYDAADLDLLLSYLKKEKIICIADEVLTGFYRTGKMFASNFISAKPDIVCLSKGITGGTIAMGITSCTQKIYEAFVSEDKTKTFFHGHSFTANPLACTAALASLFLLNKKKCARQIEKLMLRNKKFAEKLFFSNYKKSIKNIRQLGTIVAFEIDTKENDNYLNTVGKDFTEFCLSQGVYLRSLGNTIYLMPPYCITKKQLKKVYSVIEDFLMLH